MIKEKVVEILGASYVCKFPNIGNIQDIEAFKITYTNGRYSEMAFSGLKIHNALLDIADAVACFSIMIPNILMSDLHLKSWRELDPKTSKILVKSYKRDFLPWYKEIIDELQSFDSEEESDETK